MEALKACRICLNTDVRLYDMDQYRLNSTYDDLCGNNLQKSNRILSLTCAYCAVMLTKFARFKEKAQKSMIILQVMLAEPAQLTTEQIRKLKYKALPYTLQILHNIDSTVEVKEELIETNLNEDREQKENYDDKDSIDIDTDFKNDSDDEPLSKKVTKRKKRKKKQHTKDLSKENTLKSELEVDSNLEPELEMDSNVEPEIDLDNNVEPEIVDIDNNIEPAAMNSNEPIVKDRIKEINDIDSEDNIELILLTKEEQIAEILARKNSSNYQNSVYKCEFCFKGFMTEGTFKNHMVKHDLSTGPLSCGVCSARCCDARALRAHALTHARRYICRVCGHTASTRHKAGEHLQWHKGFRFVCKLCGAKFSKSTTHLTHMRLRHDSGAACDACGERFLGQSGLRMHKRKAHRLQNGESITYMDCVCGSKFRSEEALKNHRESAINNICDIKLRHCEYCGEGFEEEIFKQHLLMHSKENALRTCTECARTFASERALGLHHSRAHNANRANAQRAICEICGYTCIVSILL